MLELLDMRILAIDTSCDETSAAVTDGVRVLSNIIWSQASLHAKFGGVYPSLARQAHKEHLDWVIGKALSSARCLVPDLSAIAVTVGPGLAIALEVGISKAKELVQKHKLPLIPVNHIEGHLLSPLANQDLKIKYPALGIVVSGKHTDIILVEKIGQYKILAQTIDDALGEALDKAARMLGLGYPGGALLEQLARKGKPDKYSLPVPLAGQKERLDFSYSGLKTAMYLSIEKEKPLNKNKIQNLAAAFQDRAFKHLENIFTNLLNQYLIKDVLLGGGVSANTELRKRLRIICKQRDIILHLPYSKKLCTDNAAMVGIVAAFKFEREEFLSGTLVNQIDRLPRARVDMKFFTPK